MTTAMTQTAFSDRLQAIAEGIRRAAVSRAARWPLTGRPHGKAARISTPAHPPAVRAARPLQPASTAAQARTPCWAGWKPAGPGLAARWKASGAHAAGPAWRQIPAGWLQDRGQLTEWRRIAVSGALIAAICADIVRPSLGWLAARPTGPGALVRNMARTRDHDGFTRLRAVCDADPQVPAAATTRTLYRCANITAAKGGTVAGITIGDLLELLDAETQVSAKPPGGGAACYRMLRTAGIFGPSAPATLREVRHAGQRTPGELIDSTASPAVRSATCWWNTCRSGSPRWTTAAWRPRHISSPAVLERPGNSPPRDRQPGPAARSRRCVEGTAALLHQDRHIPGRAKLTVQQPRLNYQECLIPVRAFYMDLAQWAVEEPARWGPWVTPCPVKGSEVTRRKARRRLKSRIDARTRERLPVLPVLVRRVTGQRKATEALPSAARTRQPGATFTAAGQTLTRAVIKRPALTAGKVWAHDLATGTRHDLTLEEDHAFWAWATVEPPPDRHPHRRTATAQSPQPRAVPSAVHRRTGAAAADSPVKNRRRAAPARQPRTR